MRTRSCFLEALLDATRLALPLEVIDRAVRAVEVQRVPGGAGCLLGAIDVAGEVIPVYDLRRLLGLAARPLRAADCIVLTQPPLRCGLVVDEVTATVELASVHLGSEFGLHSAGLRGVARTSDGLLLVHDLRRLLARERAVPIHGHA